jgi:GNAT superfamily N-acetyltransferase
VETQQAPGRLPQHGGLADIGNLWVEDSHRRRGIATWLVAAAADWLGLAGVDRILGYAWPEEEVGTAFLATVGFRELTRTKRGWVLTSG